MINYRIQPGPLKGKIEVPSSKSHTLRAILFGLMGKGKTTIHNYLPSPDTTAMIEAVKQIGAIVKIHPSYLEIKGVSGKPKGPENIIDAGNSGQVLRFVGALASLIKSYTVITGDVSIRNNRPVKPLLEGLNGLGIFAKSMRLNGFAPILIKGVMEGGKTCLEGSDSQPVSGLLIASSFAKGKTEIQVDNPGEKPWIDLTLHWLSKLGLSCRHTHHTHYEIAGHGHYEGFNYTVPGDFSSLAYPLVAALITRSELTIENVDIHDIQGDKKVIDILIQMGAKISIDEKNRLLHVHSNSYLRGICIDINVCIDAITILAVVGCYAEGKTEIYNGAIARKKESDRIHAIASELKKMGADIKEKEDGLVIFPSNLQGARLKSYQDHRIAMSLSVASLGAKNTSLIEGVECIKKTYPHFAHDFQKIGVDLKEES